MIVLYSVIVVLSILVITLLIRVVTTNIELKNCILYYDGGHLNASGKVLIYDENGEEILANMEEE